jgi:hypothetical protein
MEIFFEYIAQEIRRIQSASERYSNDKPTFIEKYLIQIILNMLDRFSSKDEGSDELLAFEYMIFARKT